MPLPKSNRLRAILLITEDCHRFEMLAAKAIADELFTQSRGWKMRRRGWYRLTIRAADFCEELYKIDEIFTNAGMPDTPLDEKGV